MADYGKPIDYTSILLVESDTPLLRNIAFLLNVIGFQVTTASDAGQALDSLRQQTPDLIIAATDLPGISGYDLLHQVRADERWQHIPFIFISGRYGLRDLMHGLDLGANDYVPKPFDIYDLLDAIKRTLLPQSYDGLFQAAG